MGVNLYAAQPGMSRLAQAIGGPGAYQQGYEGEMNLQTKLAQTLAAMRSHDATAEAARAKAEQDRAETTIMSGRGGVGDEMLAAEAGTNVPTLRAYRQQLATGRPAMTSASGDPETDAAIGINPEPVVSQAIAQALTKLAPRYAAYRTSTKDLKADDLAKARQLDREGDLSDSVIAGALPRNAVAGAQAAAGGKNLFHTDSSGAVLDLFGGNLDTTNPMAGSTINLRTQQAGQAKAGAAENYAQADNARASAGKSRAETGQIVNGPKGILVQTEGGPVFADPRTGSSVSVRNPDGTPAIAAPKPLPEGAQKQIVGARNVQDAATDYIGKLQNWSNTDMLNPNQRKAMGTAYNNMMLQAKEAYNLGVLNGPDYEILQQVIADPTKAPAALLTRDTLQGQARELKRIAGNIESQVLRAHGKPAPANVPAAGATTSPRKIASDAEYNALPSGAEFIGPDGTRRRKP